MGFPPESRKETGGGHEVVFKGRKSSWKRIRDGVPIFSARKRRGKKREVRIESPARQVLIPKASGGVWDPQKALGRPSYGALTVGEVVCTQKGTEQGVWL